MIAFGRFDGGPPEEPRQGREPVRWGDRDPRVNVAALMMTVAAAVLGYVAAAVAFAKL